MVGGLIVTLGGTTAAQVAPRLDVTLRILNLTPTSRRLHDVAVAEVASLWAPHGVAIRPGDSNTACISVYLEDTPLSADARATWLLSLAHIRFTEPGRPETSIRVSMPALTELLSRNHSFRVSARGAQEHSLWRATGRVIAHELGHFLLRFPAHTPTGLLAAQHTSEQFAGHDQRPFRLSPSLKPRLLEIQKKATAICP